MKVNVEIHSNPVCEIEVGDFDTVLAIKKKIESGLGVPVSKQILFFQGKVLLKNRRNVAQCKIVHNSRLGLIFSANSDNPNRNNDQELHQTQQSLAPSDLTQQVIHSQDELLGNQDLQPLTVGTQVVQTELLGQHMMVRSDNTQVLQTEKSPVTLATVEELTKIKDRSLTDEESNKLLSYWTSTDEENLNSKDSPVVERSKDSLRAIEESLGVQDLPVGSKRNRNQVASDSVKEVIKKKKKKVEISPVKLTVIVQPFEETRKILIDVNATDKAEELRKELDKMQKRGELNLPERYSLLYSEVLLDETRSFYRNRVAYGERIHIFPRR